MLNRVSRKVWIVTLVGCWIAMFTNTQVYSPMNMRMKMSEVVVASDTMDGDFDSPSNWSTMEPVQKAERLHSNISLGLATLMVISGIMIFRTQKGSK